MNNRIYNSFTSFETQMLNLGAFVLALMGIWIFCDAMGRYVFNCPIPGTLEISEEIFMILVVFFSMSACQKEDGHVKVELFRRYIPHKILVIVDRIMDVVIGFYVIIVVYTGLIQFNTALALNSTSRGILAYPLAPVYMLLAFGMAVLFVRIVMEIFFGKEKLLQQLEDEHAKEGE